MQVGPNYLLVLSKEDVLTTLILPEYTIDPCLGLGLRVIPGFSRLILVALGGIYHGELQTI